MNIFKKIFRKNKPITNDINTTNMTSQISEPILNHLAMKTTGALFITGDWGSGKTYHIKNKIFPLIEKTTGYIPIMVSLYGETDKNNIAQKVLFAYFDSKGKDVNLKTGTIARNIKNISEAIPYIKNFVDVDKLIVGTGDNMFRLIPHDEIFICFDDIERMSDEINVDDFLGLINELVENKGFKVLIIANESEIKNGITFKEKTIEKTIHFTPNLSDIFDSIISDYQDGSFKTHLLNNKAFFIGTLTVKLDEENLNKELSKSFSNIRTLKFALEHFKIIFDLLADNTEINDMLSVQLKNIWIFTLSISIEFRKPNNITLTERKNLDNQTSTVFDFDSGNFDFLHESLLDPEVENEWTYSKAFKKMYYNRLSEPYVFYDDLYSFITSGKKINGNSFILIVEESFKVRQGKVNPAHQILNTFLHKGYWTYTNEGFVQALKELLDYCNNGELEDIVSYLNAGVYLLGFNEMVELGKDDISNKIKEGLNIFLPKIIFNNFSKLQFEMVQSNFTGEHLESLVKYIENQIEEIKASKTIEEAQNFQSLFETDVSAFVKEFLPEHYDTRTPDQPLFHNFKTDIVKTGILNTNPEGIMDLTSLLKTRYLDTSFSKYLTDEMTFLNNLNEAIAEIDFSKRTLSNHIIQNELTPRISECKSKLQSFIDSK